MRKAPIFISIDFVQVIGSTHKTEMSDPVPYDAMK